MYKREKKSLFLLLLCECFSEKQVYCISEELENCVFRNLTFDSIRESKLKKKKPNHLVTHFKNPNF